MLNKQQSLTPPASPFVATFLATNLFVFFNLKLIWKILNEIKKMTSTSPVTEKKGDIKEKKVFSYTNVHFICL